MVIHVYGNVDVLYIVVFSACHSVWKIVDFGMSTRVNSKRTVISDGFRGTNGYRAPELMINACFNKTVDVWGLGCVLFELATRTKAFESDWHIQDYHRSISTLKLFIKGIPTILQCHLYEMTQELLHRDYKLRPCVSELLPIFESYLEILCHSWKSFHYKNPSFAEWKQFVQQCPTPKELHRFLPTWLPLSRDPNAMLLSYKETLDRNPLDEKCHRQFKEFCSKYNNIQLTIAAWVDLVDRHPSIEQFQLDLALACRQLNDIDFSAGIWKKLVEKHPINVSLITAYTRALIRVGEKEGNPKGTVDELIILYASRPRNARANVIWLSLKSKGIRNTFYGLEFWKRIIVMYPDNLDYIKGLEDELKSRDPDTRVSTWIGLLEKFPSSAALRSSLQKSLPFEMDSKACVWMWFVVEYPKNPFFRRELRSTLTPCDPATRMIFWKDLILRFPQETCFLQELREELGYYDTEVSMVLWQKMGNIIVKAAKQEIFFTTSTSQEEELEELICKSSKKLPNYRFSVISKSECMALFSSTATKTRQ